MICWSLPSPKAPVSYADRQWFQDALQGKFGWGEPVFGKGSKEWVITLTRPVLDEHGKMAGILTFGMSMAQLSATVTWPSLTPGAVVSVQSDNGTFLARSLDSKNGSGRNQAILNLDLH